MRGRPAHVLRDQAQVVDVGEVFVRPRLLAGAGQDRLDHAAHALLAELVRQVVDVGVTAQDQPLLRRDDGVRRDRERAVALGLVAEAGVVAQRVHQPRLAPAVRAPINSCASSVNACPVSAVCCASSARIS